MTNTRQFTQRLNGKLSKHFGYNAFKLNRQAQIGSTISFNDFIAEQEQDPAMKEALDLERAALRAKPAIQAALSAVPGLQGRVPNSVDEIERLIDAASDLCRQNKDGSINKQDLKREMRKNGYEWDQGVYGWVPVDR